MFLSLTSKVFLIFCCLLGFTLSWKGSENRLDVFLSNLEGSQKSRDWHEWMKKWTFFSSRDDRKRFKTRRRPLFSLNI